MTDFFVFVSCLGGFCALALATERQQQNLFDEPLPPAATRRLRASGWIALGFALLVTVLVHGWALGLVFFSGQTSVCAGLSFIALVVLTRRRERAEAAMTAAVHRRRGAKR